MKRSLAREEAFKLLYSLEIQKENLDEQLEMYFENEEIAKNEIKNYIEGVVKGIENNISDIEKKIAENLKKDWKIERISKINLVLLKLAIYEIIYTETPYKVAINEAIELSKKYSDEKVTKMLNAALDKIYHNEV